MNAIKNLYDFIKTATAERKYADNTARGLNAALKLFEPHLNDAEKQSLDALENNLENIAHDIFTKRKDGKPTSDTLIVYRKRIMKVITDYKSYGSDPGKMASWNPRRQASALKQKSEIASKPKEVFVKDAEIVDAEPYVAPATALIAQGGVIGSDVSGRYIDTNRSEIYLRDGFKVIIELPVNLSSDEATKLKNYIDLMVM